MIQSMTGYGKGSAGSGAQKVNALIKSVTGRFLDIKIRGLDITICTSANHDEEALELLKAFNLPFIMGKEN